MRFALILLGLSGLVSLSIATGATCKYVAYEWQFLDWTYPNVQLTGKPFLLGNPFTQDVDVDAAGRVFVTTPQWLQGVPITLSLVTNHQGPGGPLLAPYPDWTWHTATDCDKLISVYRIAIDECNRLWIVDVGRIGDKVVCPVKILIFNLYNDQLIHKYIVPNAQTLNGKASLVTPIVEIGRTCYDAYLYVADVAAYGLLIYDLKHNHSWRVSNTPGNAFGPDADAMNITIAGESFDLTDGTLGMSLSPRGFFQHRYLYFNSLASFYQKFSDVNSLKLSEYHEPRIFQSIFKRSSQAGVQATSRKGVIFFQLVEKTALACWNIERPFVPENIVTVAQDEDALQYVSGIKVITNSLGVEELWLNTNRLQKTINNSRKLNEINFRVMRGLVDDLIRNTNCEPIGVAGPYPDISTWRRI